MYRYLFLFLLSIFSCQSDGSSNRNSLANVDPNHHLKEVVTFVYHRFGNSKYPSTNIATSTFDQHLSYLKDNNYKIFTFGDAVDYINNPEMPYYEKTACITVDDGYKTFIKNGLPILKKYGFPATVFINSESVGGGSYMDWDELKEIYEQGIEIGNHSHSHPYFVNFPKQDRNTKFAEDVTQCQEAIHNNLGFYPDVFAYPYGEFDLEMKEKLKSMGFKAAAAQNSGVMHNFDNFAFPRFPMAGPYAKLDGFKEKASMKALRINSKTPESFLLQNQNPPTLKVVFDADSADLTRYNCFVSGGCNSQRNESQITITAQKTLKNRRTLYTITAPSKTGNQWYWFSHLWIRPEIEE